MCVCVELVVRVCVLWCWVLVLCVYMCVYMCVVLCVVLCVKLGTRNTLPCVRSKRLRLYGQDVSVCTGTRRRPDRTHGGVLNGHTGSFLFSLSLLLSLVLSFLFSSLLFSFLPSFLVSRSRSVVDCAVVCGVLCVVWVHEGVVLCDELFGVLRGGGVVWCVVCGCFISLFLSILFFLFLALSLSCFFLLLSCLPLSLLSSLLANKHCVSTDQQT